MAEDVKLVLRYRVEANAPLAYQKPILLMEGDKRANVLQVSLFDGEKPVDVTGLTVGGSVLRADGADVAIEGEIDGNVISCVLSEYAYAVAGPFKAFVQLLDSLGNVKRTVLLLAGMVESRGHGPQIDTGKELPSLDDILAQLETMRNVTQAANTAAGGANTAAAAANSAASKATSAANSAITAAGTANAAADRANDAAQNWEEGTVKNADKLDGKPPEYYLTPVNLLDNSDFRNPVNQRGQTSYTAVGYTIDMWYSSNSNGVFSVGSGFVSVASASGSGAYFRQWIPSGCLELGKTYTLAACDLDGLITVRSGELKEGATIPAFYPIQISTGAQIGFRLDYDSGKKLHNVMLSTSSTTPYQIKWIALYEGSYTAETLPPYVSKENEFAACQKRCVKIHCKNKPLGFGHAYTTDTFRFLIPTPVSMANDVVPSLGFELSDGTPSDAVSTILIASGGTLFTPTAVSVDGAARENGIILLCTVSGATKYQPASLYCSGNMLISIGP